MPRRLSLPPRQLLLVDFLEPASHHPQQKSLASLSLLSCYSATFLVRRITILVEVDSSATFLGPAFPLLRPSSAVLLR